MDHRVTASYRLVGQERLAFAFTKDPVAYRSQLQTRLRAHLGLMDFYRGNLLPALRDRFILWRKPDGTYSESDEIVQYLAELPRVRVLQVSRKRPRNKWRRGHRTLIHASVFADLPDRAIMTYVAQVLGISTGVLRDWVRNLELPCIFEGRHILLERDALRDWFQANGRLVV